MKLIHQHLLLKAYVLNAPKDEKILEEWLTRLVHNIGMKVVIPARAVYVSTPGNEGLTAQIGLETSHAAIHIWSEEDPHIVQMDVYSCRCFDNEVIVNMVREWDLINYETMTIDRNDNFVVKKMEKITDPKGIIYG